MSTRDRASTRIVLLVENNTGLLQVSADALRSCGYTVLTACSADEALALLKDHWIHLAVIDARLRDDGDPLDDSGIRLALDPSLQIYQQIIYTSYLEVAALQLIQEAFGKLPPNMRVYSKREHKIGPIVDSAFLPPSLGGTGQVGINFDQHLIYSDGLSTLSLVGRLRDVPVDGEMIVARIGELEDLFGKAFAECESLRISPITSGRGGGFVLIVTPEQDQQQQTSLIVKCGARQIVAREFSNYDEYVRNFVSFAAHLTDEWPIETLHFGLLKYRIAFGDIDETLPFAEFYRRNSGVLVRQAIRHLFGRALGPWQRGSNAVRPQSGSLCRFYEDRLLLRSRDVTTDLPSLWNSVGEAIRRTVRDVPSPITVRVKNDMLSWTIGDRTIELPEPHSYLAAIRAGQSSLFDDQYPSCRCHGDLHVENIRVSDDAQTWVIDFEYTGWGPLLQDAVELESSILFGMIPERQLDRLLLLIEALADQTELDTSLTLPDSLGASPELAKALDVLGELRGEASKIEGARMADYLLGLIYHALRMITSERSPSWADMRKLAFYKTLALFLASACCRKLDQLAEPPSELEVS